MVWVPMENPKGLAMEGSSIIKKKGLCIHGLFFCKHVKGITEKRSKNPPLVAGPMLYVIKDSLSGTAKGLFGKVFFFFHKRMYEKCKNSQEHTGSIQWACLEF